MSNNDDVGIVLKEVCEKEHERLDIEFKGIRVRLDKHDETLDRLNRSDATNTQEIKNLCSKIDSLTKAIWGLVAIVATSLVGFFFYAMQSHIFGG